ncbi:MAG: HPr(Ser) kinase/phosphatase [Holdemanella sp.]|nr:HPr(Ser) kinase/phosphatase [Holdemanella sp.]
MAEVTIKDVAEKLSWSVIVGDVQALKRPVELADTNRPGLELTGYFENAQTRRIVVLGNRELTYIYKELDEVAQRRVFEHLTNDETPGILITRGQDCPPILEEIAKRKNFPVFVTKEKTMFTIVNIINFLDEKLAPSVVVHGNLIQVYGIGVLITGGSGMGKSEITLELIRRGHQLVADDRTDCYRIHNTLVGRTSPLLEGFMELRGVGVIDVARMYGAGAFAHETRIHFQIELMAFDDNEDYDRVGIEDKEYVEILGVKILKMNIPVAMGRSMATVIETAVTNYLLLKDGYDSSKEFENRVVAQIGLNKGE